MGFTRDDKLRAESFQIKALRNPGLKFSMKNGIFIYEEPHFFIVITVFSGIMLYSKFTLSGGYGHRFKNQITALFESSG